MRGRQFGLILFLIVLAVIVIGFSRGWFTVSQTDSPEGNKTDIHVTVDKDKMRTDAEKAEEKLKRGADKTSSELKRGVDKVKQSVKEHRPESAPSSPD